MKIVVINTGGTFNKVYNPISGELEVSRNSLAVEHIIESCGQNIDFRIIGMIFKDSLDLTKNDRENISEEISKIEEKNILIIHGTDTINITAQFLTDRFTDKNIILVGAMKPISINSVDGVLNFGVALGYFQKNIKNGVYISMSGLVLPHNLMVKNRKKGIFVKTTNIIIAKE